MKCSNFQLERAPGKILAWNILESKEKIRPLGNQKRELLLCAAISSTGSGLVHSPLGRIFLTCVAIPHHKFQRFLSRQTAVYCDAHAGGGLDFTLEISLARIAKRSACNSQRMSLRNGADDAFRANGCPNAKKSGPEGPLSEACRVFAGSVFGRDRRCRRRIERIPAQRGQHHVVCGQRRRAAKSCAGEENALRI